jgi:flagellar basal-body rod modification protein FlgD
MTTTATSTSPYIAPTLSPAASQAASSATQAGQSNALGQLSSNYNDFLQLLMTQLQNQDPSSPMDANQFTQELVQFSSVEQQINTNSSLTSLIQLTQQDGLLQSSALVGKQVAVANSDMPVQGGQGSIQFTSPSAQTVVVSVTDTNGNLLSKSSVAASLGSNSWSWNAKTGSGSTAPDGDYKVTITTSSGSTLSYNAVGTVTGVTSNGSSLQLLMGSVTDNLSNVQQVLN